MLDVDTGVDDALAIAIAVGSPNVELLAVSTLAGNVDVDLVTANTLRVLDWLGAADVRVHRGASRPLVRAHHNAKSVHGEDGLGEAPIPMSERQPSVTRGPAEMIRLATERPGTLTLICVGPLTNLAIALNVEPQLPKLLAGLVIMGGAFNVAGNVTPHAEFNIYADPEAAAQVFATAFASCRVVGLDVTHQTTLTRADWERAGQLPNAAARLTSHVCRRSFEVRTLGERYLHDPLTVAAAIDPSLFTWVRGDAEVATNEENRGATRLTESLDGALEVAVAVETQRFRTQFLPLLGVN